MAASPLQRDFGLTGPMLTAGLPAVSALRRMEGLLPVPHALSHQEAKVWYGEREAPSGEIGVPPEDLQEFLWRQFFTDQAQWWDNRRSKRTPRHPDFRHKQSKVALWLDNRHKPAWVDSQLATWDAGMKRPPESTSTSVQGQEAFGRLAAHEGHLEVGMCRKLCEEGRITDAVDAVNLLVQRGCHVHNNLFYRLLKRCIAHKDLVLGRRIHALAIKSGYEGNAFLATHLMGLYASHGRLDEAMSVFTKVSTPDAYNWATIIFACARHGEAAQAIRLYRQMRESTVEPDNRMYSAVIKACAAAGDLGAGKEVHAHILASPGKPDIFVQTGLVDMYAKCGSLEDAHNVFLSLPERNVVTWNAMLTGYAQQGMGQEALSLYNSMQHEGLTAPNCITFVCLLQACASVGVGALHQGKQLHTQIAERGMQDDVILGGSLVNMYAKCGSTEDARKVFDRLPERNVVTWTAMMAGYTEQGMGQEALILYNSMQQEGLTQPSPVTFVCLLQACASVGVGALHHGKELHAQIRERGLEGDVVLGSSLVNMYAKCCSLEDARNVFDRLPERGVVTWTAMIVGYTQQGMGHEAVSLYNNMQQEGLTPPDSVAFVCLLQACASVGEGALHHGKQLHAQIQDQGLEADLVVGTCLINMYAKCGSLEDARGMFDRLPDRNVVTWNAMFAGYAQQGMGQEALALYGSMQREGITEPDSFTFACLLQACAIVAALPLGKQLHAEIEERGLQADPVVGAALVNVYAKCGSMFDSQQVFDSLPERTVEAWGALTGGYTRQGDSEAVFNLLDRMRLEGIQPDGVTFLSVLTVCSHVGLVDKGRKYFEAMRTDYGISPTIEHYTCMIDLLGRAGHLEEALQMAKTKPFPRNDVLWLTLLGACRKWKNVEIGQQAFEFAVSVDAKDAACYVLMSNIYASVQMWEEAKEMQARRVKSGALKKPGQSWWTDAGGVVHTFVVGDKKHPESEGIYAKLEQLVPKMKKAGYVPHLESSLRDIPDDEKEAGLCGHSEKLAIAYALNKTPEGDDHTCGEKSASVCGLSHSHSLHIQSRKAYYNLSGCKSLPCLQGGDMFVWGLLVGTARLARTKSMQSTITVSTKCTSPSP